MYHIRFDSRLLCGDVEKKAIIALSVTLPDKSGLYRRHSLLQVLDFLVFEDIFDDVFADQPSEPLKFFTFSWHLHLPESHQLPAELLLHRADALG